MIGVNLAGAEFGSTRGKYGTDYIYPGISQLDYFKSKGVELVRLPFTWERMQPSLGGELDPAELARMVRFLDAAAERGFKVVIDLHNYGRYDGKVIGSADVSVAEFKDFWTKLASVLKDHPAIWGFGIMNEPHDMGSSTAWPRAAQAATDGIRSTGSDDIIIVSGDGWSGAHSWKQYNANLDVYDPLDNLMYEAHQYFDRGSTGVYKTYDQEGAYPMVGVDRVKPFLDWLEENGHRGFIGEYGVPDNDPRWLTVLDNFVKALEEHNIPSAYWAAGPWWGKYSLAIEPRNGVDRPQMDILERYLGDTPDTSNPPDVDHTPPDGISLFGTDGDDNLVGGDGHDILHGRAGNDVLTGGAGNDQLYGDAGNDILRGGNGNDILSGGAGNDTMGGHAGDDQLWGDDGDDRLYGDAGNDILNGGNGNDWIEGGPGNDELWGGDGADTFAFGANSGTDTIMDFKGGTDHLVLGGQHYVLRDTADGAMLQLSGGGTVLIRNVSASHFSSDWIIG